MSRKTGFTASAQRSCVHSCCSEEPTGQALTVLYGEGLPAAMEELERNLLQQALAQFTGSRRKTAVAFGLLKSNLRYRIKKPGLNKKWGIRTDSVAVVG